MSEEAKKYLVVGFTVVCLGVAGFMSYRTFFGGSLGGGDTNPNIALLCSKCGGFEVPADTVREELSKSLGTMPMMGPGGMARQAINCPKCNQKTCYVAQKCEAKGCQNIYMFGQAKDVNYPDRCPKCRFSFMENTQKNQ